MPEGDRERLWVFLEENDLQLSPIVGFDHVGADEETAKRATEEQVAALQEFAPLMRSQISITTGHGGHRFDRTLPFEEKLTRHRFRDF